MGVITAEWRKLWLPGLWLVAAVTTGCSWLLAAMMSGPRGAEQTLQLVPRFAALGLDPARRDGGQQESTPDARC